MGRYYSSKLSSERLKACYDLAPDRTKQYLEAEIQYVLSQIGSNHCSLELGCGYGRALLRIADRCAITVGVDTSYDSLEMAYHTLGLKNTVHLFQMDAINLGFSNDSVDVVVCIQNGISAFRVDQGQLLLESLRVCKPGGFCLFSSYSPKFWNYRLEWFELQADAGLLGEIDWESTGNGVISCKDGFRTSTFTTTDFADLTVGLGLQGTVTEVDGSSVFFRVDKTRMDK